jgi:beta-phosphoglucomutase-like phosphatase (HAD superfamily)
MIELDTVALDGRKVAFDVMKSILAEKDIALTPLLYSRYCLYPPAKRFLPALLKAVGKTRLSEDKLAAEITEGIGHCLVEAAAKPKPGLAKLIAKAAAHGARLGALSCQSSETAKTIAERLGLVAAGAHVQTTPNPDVSDAPESDGWRALGRSLGVPSPSCLALASSRAMALGAISIGMACAVAPDAFTGFQDFTGADLIFDTLDGDAVDAALDLLATRL